MLVKILGSAAGGGFPQWNCACRNCTDVRRGVPGLKPRSQSSLAVSADGLGWCLLNASPDLRAQIAAHEALAPGTEDVRGSPLKSVVLTNADVDHVAGLLNLREGQPFHLYASARVLEAVAANPIFNVLKDGVVTRVAIADGESFEPAGCPGLAIELFTVPGKVALYLEDPEAGANFGSDDGDVVGLKLTDKATGGFMCYVPGCASVDERLLLKFAGASALFFDGTLYTDDEMIALGLSQKTGRRMGHLSISGEDGSIAQLASLDVGRRIFIHLNNSNPVLREDSPERRATEAAGWDIAEDGMEIAL
ncbi:MULTISPECIES: pyrroloquinoline quinone biosynthesis protein PqqB [Rhodomicrobium]|uniref:pyrroloquinoline quinone biosynthesis protein PqqB n=1 Tax=Rhodomicrobium TaxID=1068 RepID=UPI000B4AE0FF|nr:MULTISPECIES: pyrroloquinoline quinone biosynthesis protein PqqB [Rhodomicrobium]